MHNWKIFLDSDGVLVNFAQRCIDLFNLDVRHNELDDYFALLKYDQELHSKIAEIGYGFWINIPIYKYANLLTLFSVNKVGRDNLYILTSPMMHSGCFSGKFDFIRKNFIDVDPKNIIISDRKHLLAGDKRILVDDKPSNIEGWKKYGGLGVLYPRPWNKSEHNNLTEYKKVQHVISQVKNLIERESEDSNERS